MINTPHILVGAVIGANIKHLGWIIILGLIGHFVLDKIPHWIYGRKALEGFSQNKSYKVLFVFFLQLTIDILIGLGIVFLIIWQKNMIKPEYLIYISVGILASILPDILMGFIKLFGIESKKLSKIYIHFHEKTCHSRKRHTKKPGLLGFGTQVLVSAIAILILML